MEKPITLEREVDVWAGRVVGTIAFPHRREELLPVLLQARDGDGTTAEDVAEHLLFGRDGRRNVARRLLDIAESLGLVVRDGRAYTLTEDGERAANEKEVFVPQDGAWTVWASDDPLLPSPVLRIDPWQDPCAFDEVNGGRDKQRNNGKQTNREFAPLPRFLRETGVPRLAAATGKFVRIDDLKNKTEPVASESDGLRLKWHVHRGVLSLKGRLADNPVDTELDAPSVRPDDIWRSLLEGDGLWHRWDSDKQALRTPFVDAIDGERHSLVRQIRFQSPSLADYGTFDPTTVADVPLAAASAEDAESWARWRLAAAIRQYATSARFDAWGKEAAAPFSEFAPRLPDRTALREALADADTPEGINHWHLTAAEDWRL